MPATNFTELSIPLLMPTKIQAPTLVYEPLKFDFNVIRVRLISDLSKEGRPVTVLFRPPTVLRTAHQPLPKPPVGKMLVNTFPPIYKERVNSVGLADTPRIFPTIFVTHKNT